LCSDGLSGQVNKDQIAEIVRSEPDLTQASRRLIDLANANGGPDNITVILARFDGRGLTAAAVEDEVGHRVFRLPDTGQSPAISMDRVGTGNTPTDPMPVISPAEAARLTPPRPANAVGDAPPAEPVDVSPARRSAGTVIAFALLAVLIVGAAWFIVHSTRGLTDPPGAGAPRP